MTKLEAAARQLLQVLDCGMIDINRVTALREALVEQVHTPYCKQAPMCKTPCGNSDCVDQADQEPVGWWNGKETIWFEHELITDGPIGEFQIPLYTAPQPVSKEQVAVLDITHGREPECYATPNADDLPEGTYRLYAAPVRTKDLTDDEIYPLYNEPTSDREAIDFARAVIAAYKEKNK